MPVKLLLGRSPLTVACFLRGARKGGGSNPQWLRNGDRLRRSQPPSALGSSSNAVSEKHDR